MVTGSESSTHRWHWNGQAWIWVARDAISAKSGTTPNSSNFNLTRSENIIASVGTSPVLHNPTATNTLSAGAASAHTENRVGLPEIKTAVPSAGYAESSREKGSSTTFKRTAAGGVWQDPSLEEWPSNDHRLFVGDLGPDANDEDLTTAFSKYPSFNMARVVKDKRTTVCRGYGFVSFASAHDMLAAIKEMNGKYVGSRPVKLQKSTWQRRNLNKQKWKQVRAIRTIAKR